MSKILIKDAVKKYGDREVVKHINLEIKDGEFFTLLGPSGCGKTTLLRMIAGFNSIEGGDFYFGDKRINDMDPSKRNIGMVFQNYAVFPNMTVRKNIEFGLRERKVDSQTIKEETDKMLKLMQIEEHAEKKPQALSGGQQQRVALARAIIIKPDVLLMDEPLSNLDAKLRVELRETIRRIQREVGITTVYVTHDQEEAMAISDRIAVMKDGVIQQCASAREIYHKPINTFVANFIGTNNKIKAFYNAKDEKIEISKDYKLDMKLNTEDDCEIILSVRPEDLIRSDKGMECKVIDHVFLGANTHFHMINPNDEEIDVLEESYLNQTETINDKVFVEIKKEKINVFTKDGSLNLVGDSYEK
ncbi:ABC transporter ATP-binding protein [Anaerococcus sp. AGMB00486]|uniref:ABC transporter ATP-binding protein n=1 Tax=Anaerococcus faecalis TaxID=2742993 RepID=A0ABX2N9C2_9FIRM|nr:ABC transporter ATP-binding protein [Anaerococcus faecalis]NVF11159.1 ABC transporter ATP-binding protein [Anaerococcus faecalis]